MNGIVVINNYGTYVKKDKEELCKALLKKSTEIWYKSRPRRFNAELDILLVYLNEATQIQVYKTGVVRIFLKHNHFEEKQSVFLNKLPMEILEILCE